MPKNFTVLVGTIGTGVWRSPNGGDSWQPCAFGDANFGAEKSVYELAVHPKDPSIIYGGGGDGVYVSRDRGASFERIESPMDGMRVWRFAVDPVEADTVYAGTSPAGVFRSRDGGQRWEKVCADFAEECPQVVTPRITGLAVDPADHRIVWAGAEVDGVRVSRDGGDTWSRVTGGLLDEPDIHAIVAVPSRTYIVTPGEICVSENRGDSWEGVGAKEHFSQGYCRSMALKADDPQVIFIGTGERPLGPGGAIQRSTDGGKTWQAMRLSQPPNSTVGAFATHPADPNFILAATQFGQVYASPDGGDWWLKLPRDGTMIRTGLAWIPN